VKSAGVRRF